MEKTMEKKMIKESDKKKEEKQEIKGFWNQKEHLMSPDLENELEDGIE
jgi:hypothetical protein